MTERNYFISFLSLFVLTAIFIPFFLKTETPKPCKKSLLLKQICSTLFLLNALAAGFFGDFSKYAIFMFIGLCFSWIGDFLLHVCQDSAFFVAGLSSFLIGHIFYTTAYCKTFSSFYPDVSLISITQVILILALAAATVLVAVYLGKISLGKMMIPCCVYALTISSMAVKAFNLAIYILKDPVTVNAPTLTAVLLMAGSSLFVFSDYTLSILTFKKDVNKHGALRQANIWTYFVAQLLLGATIYFISI